MSQHRGALAGSGFPHGWTRLVWVQDRDYTALHPSLCKIPLLPLKQMCVEKWLFLSSTSVLHITLLLTWRMTALARPWYLFNIRRIFFLSPPSHDVVIPAVIQQWTRWCRKTKSTPCTSVKASRGGPVALISAPFPLEDKDRPDIIFLMVPAIQSLESSSVGFKGLPLLLLSSN